MVLINVSGYQYFYEYYNIITNLIAQVHYMYISIESTGDKS